jgi:GNAT superfamily N-acetyltransferase
MQIKNITSTIPASPERVSLRIISDAKQRDFEDAYRLYCDAFPPGERESRIRIDAWLGTTGRAEQHPRNFIVIAELQRRVVGMTTIQYVEALGAGLLGYEVVAPAVRGLGIGGCLANHSFKELARTHRALGEGRCLGVFAEIDFMAGGSMQRRRRLIFWERLGLRPLQIAWRYPQLEVGTRPSGMYLGFKPLRPGVPPISRVEMRRIVIGLYDSIYKRRRGDTELSRVLKSIDEGPTEIGFRPRVEV